MLLLYGTEFAFDKEGELAWVPLGCWCPICVEAAQEDQLAVTGSTDLLGSIDRPRVPLPDLSTPVETTIDYGFHLQQCSYL